MQGAQQTDSLVGLKRRGRERGSHTERHRAKISEEVGDDVPVSGAAKRPPKLQVATHFEDSVSCTSKRNLLNDKLVANVPKRPG